jgi:FMN phosphatase YigB (HAD superfamily)
MKKIVFLFIILFSHLAQATWVYFDLGNTLVDTTDFTKVDYYKNAYNTLKQLKLYGYQIGLISNIPEDWGSNYNEKLNRLKAEVNNNWVGAKPFDWAIFDEIIISMKTGERKPALFMFQQAMDLGSNCPMLFVGENQTEIDAARQVGMAAHLVNTKDKNPQYLKAADVADYIWLNAPASSNPFCPSLKKR